MNWFQRRAAGLRAIWTPDQFHGWNRSRRYFEGWYFKLVNPAEDLALAVIPGISMDSEGRQFAFIQINDGVRGVSHEHRFPADSFEPHPRRFDLRIGDNRFSDRGLQLHLPQVSGRLRFRNRVPWPVSPLSPGVMGWYGLVPGMECYHGVVSMDHELEGELVVAGEEVDFTGGRGYAEKDWGRSFPRCWVWGQSNHFGESGQGGATDTSVMFSAAHIPWRGSYFVGFLAGMWHAGRLYRFTTYTKASAELTMLDHGVALAFRSSPTRRSPQTELRIVAHQAQGADLRSPIEGAMTGKVNESLRARLAVELLRDGEQAFCGVGRHAGLEIAGDTEVLFRDLAPGEAGSRRRA